MATLTAQMLVGTAHPNHGGINPTYFLFLSENSRPVWTLVQENIYPSKRNTTEQRIVWIPTVENMLEDALLMIGIYILQDPQLVEEAKMLLDMDTVKLYQDVSQQTRQRLYELSRQIQSRYKITLSVFEGSSILNQLQMLENYAMDVEVCAPRYIREYSSWTESTHITGSLNLD